MKSMITKQVQITHKKEVFSFFLVKYIKLIHLLLHLINEFFQMNRGMGVTKLMEI